MPLADMAARRIKEIGRDLAEVEAAIDAAMRPLAAQQALLLTIPGVDALTAAAIVAEIGVDMAAFGTAQRLAAFIAAFTTARGATLLRSLPLRALARTS